MEVHKFGGASIRDAMSVVRLGQLVQALLSEAETGSGQATLIIVVSAMGKITNRLEGALAAFRAGADGCKQLIDEIADFHVGMVDQLLEKNQNAKEQVDNLLADLRVALSTRANLSYDAHYDRVIPYGELLSSTIVNGYLQKLLPEVHWVDSRLALRTNAQHRNAVVDIALSGPLARAHFSIPEAKIIVTPGFLGSTALGESTTLGREGSDYTAALLGALLGANSVTIWKDVPGFLTADPHLFPKASLVRELPYREVIELAASGAKVVHPKAIKPLQNTGIALRVRSFLAPKEAGTLIHAMEEERDPAPFAGMLAVRFGQVLLSVAPRDLSFAYEHALSRIFATFATHGIAVNLMQLSAVSASFCFDWDPEHLQGALQALGVENQVNYNRDLVLVTGRHWQGGMRELLEQAPGALVRQSTRVSVQAILPAKIWKEEFYPRLLSRWSSI